MMGTTTQTTSQYIVCPFCGYEFGPDDYHPLARPMHNREKHPPIVRCRGCRMLFAVAEGLDSGQDEQVE